MAKFPSTLLPTSSDLTETRKAILDLLAKLNKLADEIPSWHKVENPGTGWFASKTAGWTADSFSGGLSVDFRSVVQAGTKAVRVGVYQITAVSNVYYRKSGDTNISNTPQADTEYSHIVNNLLNALTPSVIWLSSDYKAQFAVTDVTTDLYIAYPVECLL
jgi:hypothetical protein